ncbi:hypothetical protein [Amycolatopsis anabasis]|uniref:hypothetical protein n=1 Tax=Amycolatopsis anabasis TaxID=1840409 RepID=UPI00131B1A67|nr:hypothetical protein [Amycolatopsis anabasis]
MKRTASRILVTAAASAAVLGLAGGVAAADPVASDAPIWVVPGLDLGSLLGATVSLPTTALAPVHGLLTTLAG